MLNVVTENITLQHQLGKIKLKDHLPLLTKQNRNKPHLNCNYTLQWVNSATH
jgi:hypothetical protein